VSKKVGSKPDLCGERDFAVRLTDFIHAFSRAMKAGEALTLKASNEIDREVVVFGHYGTPIPHENGTTICPLLKTCQRFLVVDSGLSHSEFPLSLRSETSLEIH